MIEFIKKLFGSKPPEAVETVVDAKVEAANSAPYKVPSPAETTPVPLVADKTIEAVVKSIAPAKKSATKKAPAKKPAAKKPAQSATKPAGQRGRKPKAK